jgi:nitroimidazol reductase NimA-like FMN-containing flavoprotein (pyridoxamine 5'-phosphate oxidase superfamily)
VVIFRNYPLYLKELLMVEKLSQEEICEVLENNYIGRIGCIDGKKSYIVPITYSFDKTTRTVISHSGEGMKLRMLRENPNVCFETEQIEDIHHWKTVIAWGIYEELEGTYARCELHKMVNRLRELLRVDHPHLRYLSDMSNSQITGGTDIIYHIRLTEFSGRAQTSDRYHGPKVEHANNCYYNSKKY